MIKTLGPSECQHQLPSDAASHQKQIEYSIIIFLG